MPEKEHRCEGIPSGRSVHISCYGRHFVANTNNRFLEYREIISCPWCGVKLEIPAPNPATGG